MKAILWDLGEFFICSKRVPEHKLKKKKGHIRYLKDFFN